MQPSATMMITNAIEIPVAGLFAFLFSIAVSALIFSVGMFVTLKLIGKEKSFKTLFFAGIATGMVSVLLVPMLVFLFPFISGFSVIISAIINFIIIYKMLDMSIFWVIFALVLNVIVSFILFAIAPVIIILLVGILA